MLTLQMLKDMPEQTVFATGTMLDVEGGLFMSNTKKELRWVAVRGRVHDWTIYCHFADHDVEWIKNHGDKVCFDSHIRKLVECDDEAFGMYRF